MSRSTSKTLWIAAALIAGGCLVACGEKKDGAGGGEGTAKTPDKPTATNGKPDTKPDTKPDSKPDAEVETCDCRMLGSHKLADLEGGKFEAACDGQKLITGADCDQYDELRNCIYAARGNKFKRKKWQTHFGKRDWYKPRDDFNPKELSKLELANVRALKRRSAECRAASGGKVTDADIKVIKDWWKVRKDKTPPIVWSEMDEGESEDGAKHIEARLDYWKLTSKIKYWYQERPSADGLKDKLGKKKYRTVVVADCYECEKGDEDCESSCDTFEVMIGEKNDILAIYLTVAAACPFVYAGAVGETLVRQGEILRHLSSPAREARQRLALDVSCDEVIAVALVEEKPEVTFLDDIALEVDGTRLEAIGCRGAHCATDGEHTRLGPGDRLELRFDARGMASCESVALVADGYYSPL